MSREHASYISMELVDICGNLHCEWQNFPERLGAIERRLSKSTVVLWAALAIVFCFNFSISLCLAQEPASLVGKHIVGYQGWFGCPSDKVDPRWFHWFRDADATSQALSVDLWPDLSEFSEAELCHTRMVLPSGAPALVFSSEGSTVTDRHFSWMQEYDLDIAAVQRFVTEISSPSAKSRADLVLKHLQSAANRYKRGFFVMYDLSGVDGRLALEVMKKDWADTLLQLTTDAAYVQHHGKPVVGVWGLGFRDRDIDAKQAADIIDFFKQTAHVTVIGGVPSYWRTRTRDARPDAEWDEVYRKLDVISPWTVGRFRTSDAADAFASNVMSPDLEEARNRGQDYIPVVFPGFSAHNLRLGQGALDQIPRRCGSFYIEQVDNAIGLRITAIYTAMFDELDEGTAIMKVARNPSALPVGAELLAPDASACPERTDLYLRLAGEATRKLRNRGISK